MRPASTTASKMRREVLGRHGLNGARLGSFDSSAELGCFCRCYRGGWAYEPSFLFE